MRLLTIIFLSFLLHSKAIGQDQQIPDSTVAVSESFYLATLALNLKDAKLLLGKAGKDTATYVTSFKPSKGTYCILFRTRPGAFNQILSSPENDRIIEAVLNGEPFAAFTDSKYQFLATDQNFKTLEAIDKEGVLIGQKRYILVITNNRPNKLIRASKK